MLNDAKQTSLLDTGEEGNGVPALGGTQLESEEYQSPLERLIAHSTSEQRGDSVGISGHSGNALMVGNNVAMPSLRRGRILLSSPSISSQTTFETKPSLITLAACTCCLLQMGFVWASFLSPSWLETRLYLSLSLPSVQIEPDNSQLLHTTTLGSLLGDLLGADQHWAAVGLVLSSLVLPCLCAVCGAAWIVEDRKEQNLITANNTRSSRRQPNRQRNGLCPRMLIEYGARIGFSVFFILCILVIGTSPLEIEFEGSKFIVVNQIKGGMASYTLGTMFGLSVLVLLRFGRANFQIIFGPTGMSDKNTLGQDLHREKYLGGEVRGRDFECSWEVHSNELFTEISSRHANRTDDVGDAERELRTPLLQNEKNSNENPSNDQSTEILDNDLTGRIQSELGGLPVWKRVVLYELALMSTVLWIPAVFLPLFHLKYEGIVSDFIPEVSLSFRLKDFPKELWQRGVSAGTDPFILFLLEIIFVILVLVCPVMANLAAIGTWILDVQSSVFCKRLLWILQPFLGALVFGTALYLSIPAFETVTENAIDQVSSGICTNFESIAGDACFAIEAEPSVGLWFLLVDALALEIFVVLTLAW